MSQVSIKLEDHMLFICPECGEECDNQTNWRQHLVNVHKYNKKTPEELNYTLVDGKHYECGSCRKWLTTQNAPTLLQYHRIIHLPYPKTYRCRHCPGSYSKKRMLCEHIIRAHPNMLTRLPPAATQSFKDPKYNKEFFMRFLCPQCGNLFARFQQWLHHIDVTHTSTSVDLKTNRIACSRNYYCTECSHVLENGPTKNQLRAHRFTHLPYPQYFQCAFCHVRNASKTEMFLHYLKKHTLDYWENKEHVCLPDEWSGPPKKSVILDIKRILEHQAATSKPQADILQKALQNSFLNLEEEVRTANSSTVKYNHEKAMDEGLNGFETVKPRALVNVSDIADEELELICNELFEEIKDCSPEIRSKNKAIQNLSAQALQQAMQKYIHYLCPECGQEFDNQVVWRSHVFDQHNLASAVDTKFRPMNSNKTSYLCLLCYKVQQTSKAADLRRHHFQHMAFQSYLKCTICTRTKSSKPKMLQHLEVIHIARIQNDALAAATGLQKYRCLECDIVYTVYQHYKSHLRTCPKRLKSLPIGGLDLKKTTRLLDHLQKDSLRMDQLLQEAGIDANSIKLTRKQI